VYGIAAFLISFGIFKKDFKSLIISIIILILYGSLIYGVIPLQRGVSWESHLLGALVGIGTAGVLLSAITAVVVLIIQIPICIAALILPKKYPELHEDSGFKPPTTLLKIMGIGGAIISLIFVLLLFSDSEGGLIISLIVFPYIAIGIIVYFIRNRRLKNRGIDVRKRLQNFPKEVKIEEKLPGKVERLAREIDENK